MNLIIPKFTSAETEELDRLYRYAITQDEMKRFTAEMRTAQMAAVNRQLAPSRYSALGEEIAVVDPHAFFMCDILHKGCWSDDGFIKEWVRDNDVSRPIKPPKRIFNGFSK